MDSDGFDVARAAGILVLCLLAGCATKPLVPQAEQSARREALSALENWSLKGRIGFKLEKEAWSATLHWRQQADDYSLRLIAPFGKGTWELTGSDQGVTLRTADNQILRADDARELLIQNLGWDLPVSGLRYWVLGLPEPGGPAPEMEVDATGRMKSLRQDGWNIEYQSYQAASGLDLPAKMTLTNEQLRVRLNISDWKPGS